MKMVDFELVNRYLRGEASSEERIQVMEWVEESESNREEFMAMRKIYDASLMDENTGAGNRSDRRHSGRTVRLLKTFAAIAAAASLAAGVTYFLMSDGTGEENILVQSFIAPEGHRTEAVLTDGTEICLNSGSRLDILSSGDGERRVRLAGEAYLDVAHDDARPFVVETSRMEVRVLGTSFDVSTYGDVHSVVLVEGSVEVGSLESQERNIIEPDQMYTYDGNTGLSRVEHVDAASMTTWKDGYLDIRNMTVQELFIQLERYYGVSIVCNDITETQLTMSGKLILESRIDSVLDNLTNLLHMTYTIASDGVITVGIH